MKFYGVQKGRQPGVYTTWEACRAQVEGFSGAKYKSFKTSQEAEVFASGSLGQGAPRKERRRKRAPKIHGPVGIWVDGACLQHAEGGMRFGWAYLVMEGGQELHQANGNDVSPEAHVHRNVAGEITAVLRALAWCEHQGITAATVYYDYQGLASWPQGSWKAKMPFTQAYVEAVRNSGVALTWKKVLAHSGEPYNEVVDQLARAAAQGKCQE
ncbi:MAG: ribonuclease H family protein [Nitrospinae bacterium]|nr:ribonuclease H family protein [Nitrospinota bacterium]